MEERMRQVLQERTQKGTIRRLPALATPNSSIDFSTNDYLGLASDVEQQQLVEETYRQEQLQKATSSNKTTTTTTTTTLGATGSRLLSGDSSYFHQVEQYLAALHNRPAAVLCNSGYDANLSVVSSLACDVILYDEYAHNSLHMGMRLWQSKEINMKDNNNNKKTTQQLPQPQRQAIGFLHNNVQDLQRKLEDVTRTQKEDDNNPVVICILIESVYSMDGDVAPVKEILDTAAKYANTSVIVDEAHGLGVYGKERGTGVLAEEQMEHHPALACSIHTFGKAAGCHGAVVCFNQPIFKEYLVNYGYPFIYSTALPLHSVVTIQCSYQTMSSAKGVLLRQAVFEWVHLFRSRFQESMQKCIQSDPRIGLLPSTSPIQALLVPGNDMCTRFCQILWEQSNQRIRLFPIKSPTVPAGQERIRIILHSNNTKAEVELLVRLIVSTLQEMKLVVSSKPYNLSKL